MVMDYGFYIMDAIVFVLLCRWLYVSTTVKLETKVGAKWLIPAFFLVIAAVGFFRYQGMFRWVQTGCLVTFAIMYFLMKTGLSDQGIVMSGSLTKWEKAGVVTLSKNDSCIIFKLKGRDAALYFDPDQLDEVRAFLAARAKKISTDKSKV